MPMINTTYIVNNEPLTHTDIITRISVLHNFWDRGIITNWEYKTEMEKYFNSFESPKEGNYDPNTGLKYTMVALNEHKG
jgi:hypothetical protein